MVWASEEIVDELLGDWRFERTLRKIPNAESIGTVAGVAHFAPNGDSKAAYSEDGILTLDSGQSVHGSSSYYFHGRGEDLVITFDAEGSRVFHVLRFRSDAGAGLAAESTHLCAPDRYDSRYEFHPDGTFTIEHTVNGPRKSYVSRTLYRRMQP